MPIFYCENITEDHFFLPEDESRHCVKVLRKKEGDIIHVTDGKGKLIEAIISSAHPKKTECRFNRIIGQDIKKPFYTHIAIAPTKNIDRIEWFVEKCCELGIDEISFLLCKHSERKVLKMDRLEKKAISALKQSGNYTKALLNEMIPINRFIANVKEQSRFIAFVDDENTNGLRQLAQPNKSYCILIGPEGDFSREELELALANSFQKISLGNSVLRTETAGLIACHSINFIHDY